MAAIWIYRLKTPMSYNKSALTTQSKNSNSSRKPLVILLILALAAVFLPQNNAVAATLTVPDGFKTIHEAVEKAVAGDTIAVNPGTYNENIVIRKTLTLIAPSGPATTTIKAAITGEPVIKAEDVSGLTVSGFTITGSDYVGLSLNNVSNSTITKNTVVKNSVGIYVKRSNKNVISENNADHNDIEGFSFDSSSGNTIEKNNANENMDKGFFFNNSDDNSIIGNNANVNTWNGMTLYSSDRNIIKDNMTLRNTFGLVISDSKDNVESGNTTVPNIFIIFPILLVYIGILWYLVQKNILFKTFYRTKK